MPTRAVWQTKRLLDAAEDTTFAEQLELEAVDAGGDDADPRLHGGRRSVSRQARPRSSPGQTSSACIRSRSVDRDDRRRWRLTTALRLALALPHIYLVEYWGLVALVVAIVNWFIALVRGRTPLAVHDWLARYVRYSTHVQAYVFMLADPYPKFRGWPNTYPVDLRVDPPVTQSRWKIGFRLPLAIPAIVFSYVLAVVLIIVALLSWFVALAVARVPSGFQNLGAYCLRYQQQTVAYLLLLTDRYPTLASGSGFQFERGES